MTNDNLIDGSSGPLAEAAASDLADFVRGNRSAKYGRFVIAALSSIPWIGGLLGAGAALHAENEQGRVNSLLAEWIDEHRRKAAELEATLAGIAGRLDELGPEAEKRVEEPGYLDLVRQGFRVWDEATTNEKREIVRRLLTNAGGSRLCSDDLVRLFLHWIRQYDDVHFRIIRAIYRGKSITRRKIWADIGNGRVREDSAEADLFRLLISDLSIGRVIRQHRDVTGRGEFLRGERRERGASDVLESAFEDTKRYELTSLGKQFVHYALDEVAPRIGGTPDTSADAVHDN